MEKGISKNLVAAGVIIVALIVLLVVIRSITDMTLIVNITVALIFVFSFYHGVLLYGWGKMFFFVVAIHAVQQVVDLATDFLKILVLILTERFYFGKQPTNRLAKPPVILCEPLDAEAHVWF